MKKNFKKYFNSKLIKKGFRTFLKSNNIESVKYSSIKQMIKLYREDEEFFKIHRYRIYRMVCYLTEINKQKVLQIFNLSNSPSLNNYIIRYGEKTGTELYNKMRLKNSKNRIDAQQKIDSTKFKKYNNKNYNNMNKNKQTKLDRYGDENYNNSDKAKQTCLKKYKVDNVRKSDYFFSLMVQKNKFIDKSLKTDFEKYKREVIKVTNQQNIKTLEHFEKRGHSRNKQSFHLDHRFSIFEGFNNNISPYLIGSIHNLEMIESSKNSSKQGKCSLTIEELIYKFEKGIK